MKANWEPRRLGNAVTLVMGQAPAGSDCNRDGIGTPFVKVGEFGEERPIVREWTTDPKKLARTTDVLICVVGATCGKINLGADCAIGRSVASIRPKTDKIEQRYLWYFMQGKVQEMRQGSQGAAQTVINREMINELLIPLPPLDEQRRIVAVLDKAFAGIATATANAQKNLTNARALFESYQSRLFNEAGDSVIPLGEIADFRNGLNFTGSSKGEIIRIVGVKDFQNRLWIPDENLAEVQIEGKLASSDVLKEGDILTVRSNGNRELIGRCMVAPAMSAKTSHSGFTIRIRTDSSKVDPKYLCCILKSPQARKQLVDGGNGANISSLNQQLLGSLPVPVPDKLKQLKIVRQIDEMTAQTDSLRTSMNAKLAALTELKQSLLQKAFAGELT